MGKDFKSNTSSQGESRIVLGGGSFLEVTHYQLEKIFSTALKNKINRIDTSPCYANSESKIGEVLSGNSGFKLKTKICRLNNQKLSREHVLNSIEASLKALKVDKIDSIHLHEMSLCQVDDQALATLVELKTEGIVNNFGVSSDNNDLIEFASLDIFDSYMASLNLIDLSNLAILQRLIQTPNVKVIIKRALANGVWRRDARFLALKYYKILAGEINLKDTQSYYFRHRTLSNSFGRRMSSQDYMRFALFWNPDCEVLIGTRDPLHLQEFRDIESSHEIENFAISQFLRNWEKNSRFNWKAHV
jgi:aryl-alcohol dehydrogenase-like predicted oxidoreductase